MIFSCIKKFKWNGEIKAKYLDVCVCLLEKVEIPWNDFISGNSIYKYLFILLAIVCSISKQTININVFLWFTCNIMQIYIEVGFKVKKKY